MLNVTKYIQLNKADKKIYNILRLLLFILFIVCILTFTQKLLFPSKSFHLNVDINSLANTISKPYISENGTTFDISAYGDFDTAQIEIELQDVDNLPKHTELLARKSYLAFLSQVDKVKYIDHINNTYEIGNDKYINKAERLYIIMSQNIFNSYIFKNNTILSENELPNIKSATAGQTGFAPGTLLQSKTGVFVTDGNTKHAFTDEFAVKSLGYNFDNVIKASNEELNMHKKAKIFDSSSSHPFGTIFFAKDSNRTYIYDKNLLHKIQNSSTAQKHAIIVNEESRDTFESCILKKNNYFSNKYSCTMKLNSINSFNGNAFQFIIKDVPNVAIQKSNITFKTRTTKNSLAYRIEMLKKELSKIYIQ